MLESYNNHNRFRESGIKGFQQSDPHLRALSALKYRYSSNWWQTLSFDSPGIYILTGGRQVGKSTSCKLLISYCLQKKLFDPKTILYLPCDEIYDAQQFSQILRFFFDEVGDSRFLLIIDEVTFVKDWDRVIKAIADEGYFTQGLCLLTGSDTLILKEAAMRFPGRRGNASQVDFHIYPLTFSEYVRLLHPKITPTIKQLAHYFNDYLKCGGYLRAINDYAEHGKVMPASFLTYEQWIRGDFLKQGKNEEILLNILLTLLTVGVSQISYSKLTQKMGLIAKDTLIDYCNLLERMDILIHLQAFDQNKKQGFPRKDRKFHFVDPFIYRTIHHWLQKTSHFNNLSNEATLVEACVASHCYRFGKTFYFKGQGEIDVIRFINKSVNAIEIKWSTTLKPVDLKTLKQFRNNVVLTKSLTTGYCDGVSTKPVVQFLYELG